MNLKFFLCKHCGNIVVKLADSGVDLVCCGDKMVEIVPGIVEAAKEKHLPIYSVNNGMVYVTVGAVEHPMLVEHDIEWIVLETSSGYQIKYLKPGSAPKATFSIAENDEVFAVYSYCNLHGLWKS